MVLPPFRKRRIKCDEQRPACRNCTRSKIHCPGYPPPSRSAFPHEEIRIAPKPNPGSAPSPIPISAPPLLARPRQREKYQKRETEKLKSRQAIANSPPQTPDADRAVMLYRPSVNLPFNQQEGLYFQLFQTQTASELSGFFDHVFWTRSVLQECYSETPIRHAVIALGALYKTLEKTCESPPGSPSADHDPVDNANKHWDIAIKKYSHVCLELSSPNPQIANRTRLMGSVLLACFDSFVGHHQQAIGQIQTGLSLLEELRAERRRSFMSRPEEPVEEELIQMFTRLAIQAKSYDMAFHFPHPYVIRLNQTDRSDPLSPTSGPASPVAPNHDPIPKRFASSHEARLAWDALVERIFKFTEAMFNYMSNGPMGVLPSSLNQNGAVFKDQIDAWSEAYKPILDGRMAFGVTDQEKAAIAALKMAQIMSKVLLSMTFSSSEMQFDAFTPDFKFIVDLALEVVGDEEKRAAAKRCPDPNFCPHHADSWTDMFGRHENPARHIKPSFSADLGIVPPLFVVATKCRDPVVRRQAIRVLKGSARREGMWDSELAARIGMWIASIEEQDGGAGALDLPLKVEPGLSPPLNVSPQSFASAQYRANSSEFAGNVALGPGGNARYDYRRGSQSALTLRPQPGHIPAQNRVMIKAVNFDLRARYAHIELGTRGLPTGTPDLKTQNTRISW